MKPAGHNAVMASRREPPDSLDLFVTPPWATRALLEHVLAPRLLVSVWQDAWDPACGFGHISAVLQERFGAAYATDIFEHGGVHGGDPAGWLRQQDFLDETAETPEVDWIITNPPFKAAEAFALRALSLAKVGVAFLVRLAWIEGEGRFERLFSRHRPTFVAQFVERVPMHRGRWEPNGATATAYAWVVWCDRRETGGFRPDPGTRLLWIPPGCRQSLTRPDDVARFAPVVPLPLLPAE